MWGPLVRLRRWLRPLPTVGWVFLLEWKYPRYSHDIRMHWKKPKIEFGLKHRSLCIPLVDGDEARAEADRLIAEVLNPGATIIAVREADRRDIPADWCGPRVGPPRHSGFSKSGLRQLIEFENRGLGRWG